MDSIESDSKEITEIMTAPLQKPKQKRAFVWTEGRKAAWEKAQQTRAHNIEMRKDAKKTPIPPPKRIVRRYVEVEESDEEEPVIVKKVRLRAPEPSDSETEPEVEVRRKKTRKKRPPVLHSPSSCQSSSESESDTPPPPRAPRAQYRPSSLSYV